MMKVLTYKHYLQNLGSNNYQNGQSYRRSGLTCALDPMKTLKILFFIKFKLRFYENICGALRDLAPFAKAWNLILKVIFLHGCYSRFLNCTNGAKLRNAPHVIVIYMQNVRFISYTLLILKLLTTLPY